jgi:hypothetical protein
LVCFVLIVFHHVKREKHGAENVVKEINRLVFVLEFYSIFLIFRQIDVFDS